MEVLGWHANWGWGKYLKSLQQVVSDVTCMDGDLDSFIELRQLCLRGLSPAPPQALF